MLFGLNLLLLKSKAAVSVQNELEYATCLIHAPFINPEKDANKLIEVFCEKNREILKAAYRRNGLPHKLSLAAIASCFAYDALSIDENPTNESFIRVMQLVAVRSLITISSQEPSIKFKDIDHILLEKCQLISLKSTTDGRAFPVIPDDLRDY